MISRLRWTRGEDLGRSTDELVLTISRFRHDKAGHPLEDVATCTMGRSDVAEMVAQLCAWLADLPDPKRPYVGYYAKVPEVTT